MYVLVGKSASRLPEISEHDFIDQTDFHFQTTDNPGHIKYQTLHAE